MRLPRPSRPKFSWPAAIAVLALVVATTGTAAAVTGTVVNIADGTTATHIAKVDSLGRLSVALGGYAVSAGQLQTVNGSPSQPLNLFTSSGNVNGGGSSGELIVPTTAKISLTALTVALGASGNADPWQVILYIVTVANGTPAGSCSAAGTGYTPIMALEVRPGQTVTWGSSSPLTLAPPAGQTRCLLAYAFNDTGLPANNFGFLDVSGTGYVSAGTYSGPHNISTATLPKAALPGTTAGHH